jgi:hypothetical protein
MGSPQGTGGAIEDAARAATEHHENPVEHYAQEAREAVDPPALTPRQEFMKAQHTFIEDQTAFIHAKDPVQMRGAHIGFLIALMDYIASHDQSLVLTLGERYITDMQQIIAQRNMF